MLELGLSGELPEKPSDGNPLGELGTVDIVARKFWLPSDRSNTEMAMDELARELRFDGSGMLRAISSSFRSSFSCLIRSASSQAASYPRSRMTSASMSLIYFSFRFR